MTGAWMFLAGCATPTATDSADLGEDAAIMPEWSVAEVQAFVDLHLADARPEPAALGAAYQRLLTNREQSCPQFADPDRLWSTWAAARPDGCTTSTGWHWYGLVVGGAGCPDNILVSVLASFEVNGPAGEFAVAGGAFQLDCSRDPDAGECTGQVSGTFRFSGEGPGLEGGYAASLFMTEQWGDGARTLGLDGGMTWPDGTLAFRSVELADGVARGSIAIRDPGARWFEAVLPPSLVGCQALTFSGEEVGELCMDLTSWSEPLGRMYEECVPE